MKIFRAGLLAPLALLCVACAPRSVEPPVTAPTVQWDSRVIEGRLENGLRYRLVAIDDQPGRIDIRLRVDAGSADESDDQVGVAHLLEHMLFYNRDAEGRGVRQRLQQAGWQQGRHFNAMTSQERTHYMLSPPAGNRDTSLALSALAQLVSQRDFSASDLSSERPIVIEEWRGGLGVAQRMNDQRRDSQRVGSRYAGHPPIGSEQAIRTASVLRLWDFHQRWYVPNNMQLNIVGDFQPKVLQAQIAAAFARPVSRPLPARDLDLTLLSGLKAFRLQDSESGSRQVNLMFRGHYSANRAASLAGQRERLLDRIATRLMLVQLQRQELPVGVRAFSLQRAQFGERSEVLAIAASLEQPVHHQALRALLAEVQRMRRFGLYQADLDLELDKLRQVAGGMLTRGDERDFSGWVELLGDPSQMDSPVQLRSAIARNSLVLLEGIRLDEINQRVIRWTDSTDLVLQMSDPGNGVLPLPSAVEYDRLLAGIDTAQLAAPTPAVTLAKRAVVVPALPAPAQRGSIVTVRRHDAEQVQYWSLSNGDRLVWLKRPDEAGKARLQIESARGYQFPGRQGWLEQSASQLVWNSPPAGFDEAQWQAWMKREQVPISLEQQATRSTFKAEVDSAQVATLFALYRSRVTQPSLATDSVEQAREDFAQRLARERPSARQEQERALAHLRFGPLPSSLPQLTELNLLERDNLLAIWRQQMAAPVTYYLLADVPEADLREWVSRDLAAIARRQVPVAAPLLQQRGVREQRLAVAIEPRASLQVFSFSERPWTPEDAVRVASLKQLAGAALKERLRTEARGLYQLTFESELNQASGRLESRLLFSSDPQRLDELWHQAEDVLRELPQQIDQPAVDRLKAEFLRQEGERLKDNATQLNRLILSDRQWGDPRYLSRQRDLPEALQLGALRELASQLLVRDNQIRLDVLPRLEVAR